MRLLLIPLALVLAGCGSTAPKSGDASAPVAEKKKVRMVAKAPPKPAPPIVDPAFPITGKISLVNEKLRFVVVDFSLGRKPDSEMRLGVFRDGQKVGSVRVSSQEQNGNVAADLTEGEVRIGDIVREN